jgi:hypothetical protein
MLLDATNTAKAKGFVKEYPAEKIAPGIHKVCFKANYNRKSDYAA